MGYLAAECLKCGFQFDIHAETIEAQREMFCPNCSLRMDDRLWRKFRIGFLTMEETVDRMNGPVLEVDLFRASYRTGDSAEP